MPKKVRGSTGRSRPSKRVPQQAPPEAQDYRHLVWRFGRLDHATDFACHTLVGTDVQTLEGELERFQKEPIYQLRRKDWLKFIGKDEMTPTGQKALSQVSTQEDGLWQLHLGQHKWRIWGHFDQPEFFFLFWDPDHQIATGKSRRRRS